MGEDDLEERIARMSNSYDDKREARAAAMLQTKKNREEFLHRFQEAAKTTINPIFQRAERASTDTVRFKARTDEAQEVSELRFTVKNRPESTISGCLRYRANLDSLQVFLEQECEGKPIKSGVIAWLDMVPEKIESLIIFSVNNLESLT
jgi:hypothetical protein